jgi:hypothetical protein
LCRSGYCQRLNNPAAGCVSVNWGTTSPADGADVLTIGMAVSSEELQANPRRRLTGAVGAAISELNRARTESGVSGLPALVGVACDEARPEALDYLVNGLQARVILGPFSSRFVESTLAQTGEGAILFSPSADAPYLKSSSGESAGLLVSCRPNRSAVRAYLLRALAEVRAQLAGLAAPAPEPPVTVLAVSNDVATTSFADGFDDRELAAAGVLRIPYTAEPRGRGLVAALNDLDTPPELVIAASAEDAWQDNIAALDGASYARSQRYPYYLLADKRGAVRTQTVPEQVTAEGFPRQYMRLLGLDYHRAAQSSLVYAEFTNAFYAEARGEAEPGLEYAYDCAYVAVYAAIAAGLRFRLPPSELSALAILGGLGALQSGGPGLPVRSLSIGDVMTSLVLGAGSNGSVNLIGASGELEFHQDEAAEAGLASSRQYHSVAVPDGELYCIDSETLEYCNTGVVFPASGAAPNRSGNSCACLEQVGP